MGMLRLNFPSFVSCLPSVAIGASDAVPSDHPDVEAAVDKCLAERLQSSGDVQKTEFLEPAFVEDVLFCDGFDMGIAAQDVDFLYCETFPAHGVSSLSWTADETENSLIVNCQYEIILLTYVHYKTVFVLSHPVHFTGDSLRGVFM